MLKHRKLLNEEFIPFMNLTFIVGGEKVYALRPVVEQRCPYLLSTPKYIKKKKKKKEIQDLLVNPTDFTKSR